MREIEKKSYANVKPNYVKSLLTNNVNKLCKKIVKMNIIWKLTDADRLLPIKQDMK